MIKRKPVSETVKAVLPKVQKQFAAAGLENPRLEAELILSEALDLTRADLYLAPERTVSAARLRKIHAWVRARARRVPLAYIMGKSWFREIELLVNPSVLVPRPETELLVEQALELITSGNRIKKILDLGTGSGAIILSIATELRPLRDRLRLFASDLSAPALKLAHKNAQRLGLRNRIKFRRGDLFRPFPKDKFDLIICNPPYIPDSELKTLMPEVSRHEPRLALKGGKDGLEIIRKIMEQAPAHLHLGGWLMLEIGKGQAQSLKRMPGPELKLIRLAKDYHKIERIAIFQAG